MRAPILSALDCAQKGLILLIFAEIFGDAKPENLGIFLFSRWCPRRDSNSHAREGGLSEVKDLRREARDLKEVVAEQALELRLLKKA